MGSLPNSTARNITYIPLSTTVRYFAGEHKIHLLSSEAIRFYMTRRRVIVELKIMRGTGYAKKEHNTAENWAIR